MARNKKSIPATLSQNALIEIANLLSYCKMVIFDKCDNPIVTLPLDKAFSENKKIRWYRIEGHIKKTAIAVTVKIFDKHRNLYMTFGNNVLTLADGNKLYKDAQLILDHFCLSVGE